MHDLDEIRLRGHDLVDRLVGGGRLVDDVRVLAALDVRRGLRVILEREPAARLRAWVAALPTLSPRTVLASIDVAPPLASRSAWELVLRTHGFVVSRLVRSMRFDPGGARVERSEALGVRWLAGHRLDEAARLDLMRTVFLGSGDALRELRAEPTDARGRRSVIETENAVHEFAFGRHPRAAFDYRCTRRAAAGGREPALQGEADPAVREATAVAADVALPARELELRVQLSAAAAPPSFALFAAPGSCVPPLGAAALARALVPDGVPLRWQRARCVASVRLTAPVPNMRYVLAWLPSDEAPVSFAPVRGARGATRLACLSGHAVAHAGDQVKAARELAGLLHPQGLEVRVDLDAGVAELRVEQPLLGYRYSITWTAP